MYCKKPCFFVFVFFRLANSANQDGIHKLALVRAEGARCSGEADSGSRCLPEEKDDKGVNAAAPRRSERPRARHGDLA